MGAKKTLFCKLRKSLANFALMVFREHGYEDSLRNRFAFGIIAITFFANAQQPPPLRFNVPYTCPGNVIVVVKHCEMRGGAEVCSLVKGAPNGPLGDEISMPKAQAAALGVTR